MSAISQTDDVDYEVYPISDTCKKTRLHHNLINGGFVILFYGLRFSMMLIISFCKTRGQVFSNKGDLMWTIEKGGAHTWP